MALLGSAWPSASSFSGEVPALPNLERPALQGRYQWVDHQAFQLEYAEEHEQARWVAYTLTKSKARGGYQRSNNFHRDYKISTHSAHHSDYKGSGYDRGHLAPAGDMAWSAASMSRSFLYSNISPQRPGFNRGIWKRLESKVRAWALLYDSLYIATGPVLTSALPKIGPNQVSVPAYYYKAILHYNGYQARGIAFLLPARNSRLHLKSFALSIDSLEAITKIDFFPALPDRLEKEVEARLCKSCWDWSKSAPTSKATSQSASVQCKGFTQQGLRCRNRTRNPKQYCHHHQSQQSGSYFSPVPSQKSTSAVQCSGTTQSGRRCKRMTKSADGRCYQHGS